MKFLITALLLTATSAFAHFEIGTYKGKTADGTECSFTVESVSFEHDIHHPLNERVKIKLNDAVFTFQHLPLINTATKSVKPEGGKLTATVGTETGSFAFILLMDKTPTKEGPADMTTIWNAKDAAQSLSDVCSELVFQGK